MFRFPSGSVVFFVVMKLIKLPELRRILKVLIELISCPFIDVDALMTTSLVVSVLMARRKLVAVPSDDVATMGSDIVTEAVVPGSKISSNLIGWLPIALPLLSFSVAVALTVPFGPTFVSPEVPVVLSDMV